MRQPSLPRTVKTFHQALQRRGKPLQGRGDFCVEQLLRCIRHGPRLCVQQSPGRLVSANHNVLHCLHLGLFCQRVDADFKIGQLARQPSFGCNQTLGRFEQDGLQRLGQRVRKDGALRLVIRSCPLQNVRVKVAFMLSLVSPGP